MRHLITALALAACHTEAADPTDPAALDTCPAAAPASCDERTTRWDNNGDGVDESVRYELWDGPLLLETLYDNNADGLFDTRETITYDDHDRKILTEADWGNNGSIDTADRVTITTARSWTTWITDRGDDGIIDAHLETRADTAGRTVESVDDSDGDGLTDLHSLQTWDAADHLTSARYDNNADGVFDQLLMWTWEGDLLTAFGLDGDADGMLGSPSDVAYALRYDDCGRVIETTIGHGATVEKREIKTWDAQGRQTSTTFDDDGDGTPELVETWIWSGDDVRIESDSPVDGTPDAVSLRTYDALGHEVAHFDDNNNDGVFETGWTADLVCPV